MQTHIYNIILELSNAYFKVIGLIVGSVWELYPQQLDVCYCKSSPSRDLVDTILLKTDLKSKGAPESIILRCKKSPDTQTEL